MKKHRPTPTLAYVAAGKFIAQVFIVNDNTFGFLYFRNMEDYERGYYALAYREACLGIPYWVIAKEIVASNALCIYEEMERRGELQK